MQNTPIHCSSCDYTGRLVHRPVTLTYQLPGGQEFQTGRKFCWCNTCGEVRESESDFSGYLNVDDRIEHLKRATRKLGARTYNVIDRLLGGAALSEDERELNELLLGRKIAKARSSAPRCLDCGEPDVEDFDQYIHTCGGRLIKGAPLVDAPRFNYAPESIYLDYEGRRLLTPIDPYIQFAQTAEIECVMENGIFALVYVNIMFEEEDFAPLLEDKEKFKKFAKIIELRIMHDDFNNPLAGYTEPPDEAQMASLPEATRALIIQNKSPISKWLRSQIMTR